MIEVLVVLSWIAILILGVMVYALSRQIGVLHERILRAPSDSRLPAELIARDFADNLTNGFRISVASGAICIGGIFFLGWGLVASILLYNGSRVVSVANSPSCSDDVPA